MSETMVSAFGLDGKAALNAVHNAAIFGRRVTVLTRHLAEMIPAGGKVLDLGCGDGSIAKKLMERRPDLKIQGVDVMIRPQTHIPVSEFDGNKLPFRARSFDYVTIVDVLHHTDHPAAVLKEAVRVARKGIVVKDHLLEGLLAGPALRFMDWVGNKGHNVVLPYNYLSRAEWVEAFEVAGCKPARWTEKVGLYPAPASWLFDRHLHFVALLTPKR
jgi:SAM-dependent methyltransferase